MFSVGLTIMPGYSHYVTENFVMYRLFFYSPTIISLKTAHTVPKNIREVVSIFSLFQSFYLSFRQQWKRNKKPTMIGVRLKEQTLFKSPLQVDVPSGPDPSCSTAIKGARGAGKDGTGSHFSTRIPSTRFSHPVLRELNNSKDPFPTASPTESTTSTFIQG